MRRCLLSLILLALLALVGGCERKLPDSVDLDQIPVTVEGPKDTPLHYDLEKTIPTEFKELRGVAVDAGDRIYLVGDGTLLILDADGREVKRWPTPGETRCVAIGEDGSVYVGLPQRIVKYDREGVKLHEWGKPGRAVGELGLLTGITVGGMNVFVADAANRCIVRYDVNGDYVSTFGRPDRKAGIVGILVPSPYFDCVLDGEELINCNPGRRHIQFRNVNGELLRYWGTSGIRPQAFCGCCNPGNVAVTSEGNIVTSEKGIVRVKVYDREGNMLAYIGPEHFAEKARGVDLAVDSKGRILVIDPAAKKLLIFKRRIEEIP